MRAVLAKKLVGPPGILLLDLVVAAGGLALWAGPVRALPISEEPLLAQWWLLALALGLAEGLVVHVQFRKNAYSFTFTEVPLVVGLYLVAPAEIVLAQVVATAAVLSFVRRQPPLKLAFNVALSLVQSCVVVLVFHALAGDLAEPGPMEAAGAMIGMLSGTIASGLLIGVAISITEETWRMREALGMVATSLVGVAASVAMALMAVQLLWHSPWAGALLLAPSAALFAAYRAYEHQRRQREGIEFLYEAMRALDRGGLEAGLLDLLEHLRQRFNSEVAQMLLVTDRRTGSALRASVGREGGDEPLHAIAADEALEGWGALISSPSGTVVRRDDSSVPRVAGILDGMLVPMDGDGFRGYLMVANRVGDVGSYRDEDLTLLGTLASHLIVSFENGSLERDLADLARLEREKARLLDGVVRAAEDERTRVAAELHDGPVQRLAATVVGLDRLRLRLQKGDLEGAAELLDKTEGSLGKEVADLRALMSELRPPVLDEMGLEAALASYVESFREKYGLAAEVVGGLGRRLGTAQETVLYRTVQEALTNVRKHAKATRVVVTLSGDPGSGRVEIRDDGVGFDPSAVTTGTFGLSVMRERLEMAGGAFELRSDPGMGTTIVASLPMGRGLAGRKGVYHAGV